MLHTYIPLLTARMAKWPEAAQVASMMSRRRRMRKRRRRRRRRYGSGYVHPTAFVYAH